MSGRQRPLDSAAFTGNRLGESLSLKMQQSQRTRDMKLRKWAFEKVLHSSAGGDRYDSSYRSSLAYVAFLLLMTFFISEFAKSETTGLKVNPAINAASLEEPVTEQETEAARGIEMLLVDNMIQQMRKTVPESELMPASHGERVFQQMLDSEYARVMSESGSIGIAELIVAQMHGKR